jgi:hypothetical protein
MQTLRMSLTRFRTEIELTCSDALELVHDRYVLSDLVISRPFDLPVRPRLSSLFSAPYRS